MDIEKDSNREAFEAWFESRYDAHFMQFALDLDMYADKHTQTCWEAWQAAKAQAIPDGFVLVTKEPTQKMLDATINVPIPAVYVDSISGHHKLKVAAYYKAMIGAQEQANESE